MVRLFLILEVSGSTVPNIYASSVSLSLGKKHFLSAVMDVTETYPSNLIFILSGQYGLHVYRRPKYILMYT